MNGLVKKYLPYAIVIFAVFIIVPLFFLKSGPLGNLWAVPFYFILLTTAVVTSAVFCAKNGIDFLFTLIAPIAFLFTMIYSGGFSGTNLILLFVYLVAGVFGQFLGDLAFGDERRKKEKREQEEQERLMLRAKRRDEREKQRMAREGGTRSDYSDLREERNRSSRRRADPNEDDFDYDKYMADIDKMLDDDRGYDTSLFE